MNIPIVAIAYYPNFRKSKGQDSLLVYNERNLVAITLPGDKQGVFVEKEALLNCLGLTSTITKNNQPSPDGVVSVAGNDRG